MKKICLPRRASRLGCAIAYLLKEKYGIKEFYEWGYWRKDAERALPEGVSYTPLFIRDELREKVKNEVIDLKYLKFLEKEYGLPNLWPYMLVDRYFMMDNIRTGYSSKRPPHSHEEMLKHLQVNFREISEALKEKRPSHIIFFTIGGLDNYVLYSVAKKLGIKTVFIANTRVKDMVTLVDNSREEFSKINRVFNSLKNGSKRSAFKKQAIKFLKDFRRATPSWYGMDFPRPGTLNKFLLAIRYLFHKDFLFYLRNRLIKFWRKVFGLRGFFEEPKEFEDFAFFTLHQEPEIATMFFAPFYTNQLALIQNIAKSLPINFKLYVKEHPCMLYQRPPAYYEELRKIPNVRIINPEISGVSLIKKAKLVLTITGSAGWEAVLLKKPGITFGDVFYNKLSMAKRCHSIEELPCLIKEQLENYSYREDELIDFISAILENSKPLDLFSFWEERSSFENIIKDKNFRNFVDFLAKELNLGSPTSS